jgi:hypothetical protein
MLAKIYKLEIRFAANKAGGGGGRQTEREQPRRSSPRRREEKQVDKQTDCEQANNKSGR